MSENVRWFIYFFHLSLWVTEFSFKGSVISCTVDNIINDVIVFFKLESSRTYCCYAFSLIITVKPSF